MKSEYYVCPFCNEEDFDVIGLKAHFTRGYCDVMEKIETIEEERERLKKEREVKMRFRSYISSLLIQTGMAIMPKDVRKLVQNTLLYNVEGALTDEEKTEVELMAKHIK